MNSIFTTPALNAQEENDGFSRSSSDKAHCDHPLSCDAKVDRQKIEALGLPATRDRRLLSVRNAIVTGVMLAHVRQQRVSYSRNNNYYAAPRRYRGLPFTKTNILATVDMLRNEGLIEENRAKPGDHLRTGKQSTIWPTDKMLHLWGDWSDAELSHDPHEVIVLKNGQGSLIDYKDNDERRRQRRTVMAYNEALTATKFKLQGDDVNWDSPIVHVPTKRGGVIVLPHRKAGYRVFNGDWGHGGRYYGAFWQGLPRERRAQLLIDGCPVEEPDFPQLHPRLLYAEFGLKVDGDAYTEDPQDKRRPLFKIAWQVMVNADSRQAGMWALAGKLADNATERDGAAAQPGQFLREASGVLRHLEKRHARVRTAFYTGAGLRLQRTDSDLAMRVVTRLMRKGIVAAAVHDSFVVPVQYADLTKECMASELGLHRQ
jgi:hypothetical protein